MPDPSLLLLIPAYNEESRIEPVLRDYAQFLGAHYPGKFQIVVILNGCTDNTLGVVQKVAAEFPAVRADEFKQPIGKGGALIEGLKLAALGDFIGYTDADGATSPAAFLESTKHIGEADCVVTPAGCRNPSCTRSSRRCGAWRAGRPTSSWRRFSGRTSRTRNARAN